MVLAFQALCAASPPEHNRYMLQKLKLQNKNLQQTASNKLIPILRQENHSSFFNSGMTSNMLGKHNFVTSQSSDIKSTVKLV
jgi:hypothetical protein